MGKDTSGNQKGFSFGTCHFSETSPERSTLSPETSALNLKFSFEDALKLNLAIDECVRKLNRYNRSKKEGKRTALNLTIFLKQRRVSVNETKLKK